MRRDSANQRYNDNFGVMLDTFHDRRNGFIFTITPSGGFTDALVTDERAFNPDWNTVWDNSAARIEDGWIAEMAIPFKSLRYAPGRRADLGHQPPPHDPHQERIRLHRPDEPGVDVVDGDAARRRRGHADRPRGAAAGRQPGGQAVRAVEHDGPTGSARPAVNNDLTGDAGVDVKYGVTKALTADFTYRTDFAQVEDDEAQVNLTRFALSFPEKREFFLEGAGHLHLVRHGRPAAAVSGSGERRAVAVLQPAHRPGRQPRGADHRRRPPDRKVGKWTVGALDMQADEDPEADVRQTNFGVLRVRRDVGRRSTIGAMVTDAIGDAARAPAATRCTASTAASPSSRTSTSPAMPRGRRRPALSGRDYSYRGNVTYGGDRWGVLVDRTAVEDNFNPEIGFLRRTAFRSNFGGLPIQPAAGQRSRVRQYHFEGSLEYVTNTRNQLESRQARGNFRIDMQNGDSVGADLHRGSRGAGRAVPIATGMRIPVGSYTFQNARLFYTSGAAASASPARSRWTRELLFRDARDRRVPRPARDDAALRRGAEPVVQLGRPAAGGTSPTRWSGNRATFTMSPRMFVAALVQYTSSTTSVLTNVRLRWEYSPGSELFIVYSEGRDTDPLAPARGNPIENRGLTIKITKLLRL